MARDARSRSHLITALAVREPSPFATYFRSARGIAPKFDKASGRKPDTLAKEFRRKLDKGIDHDELWLTLASLLSVGKTGREMGASLLAGPVLGLAATAHAVMILSVNPGFEDTMREYE